MKTRFLFPHKWRMAGYVLLLFAVCIVIINCIHEGDPLATTAANLSLSTMTKHQLLNLLHNDLIGIFMITGLVLIGFSKEKIEDEQIAQIRLESLQWAIYCNYIILLICLILFNGWDFFFVMMYNILTPLLFFIIRFRWKLYMNDRLLNQSQNS